MVKKYSLLGLVIMLSLLLGACNKVQPVTKKQVEVQFVTHLAAEMPEQDVYVSKISDPEVVFCIDGTEVENYRDTPLYAAAETPFNLIFEAKP